jgi:hypothetical protein
MVCSICHDASFPSPCAVSDLPATALAAIFSEKHPKTRRRTASHVGRGGFDSRNSPAVASCRSSRGGWDVGEAVRTLRRAKLSRERGAEGAIVALIAAARGSGRGSASPGSTGRGRHQPRLPERIVAFGRHRGPPGPNTCIASSLIESSWMPSQFTRTCSGVRPVPHRPGAGHASRSRRTAPGEGKVGRDASPSSAVLPDPSRIT